MRFHFSPRHCSCLILAIGLPFVLLSCSDDDPTTVIEPLATAPVTPPPSGSVEQLTPAPGALIRVSLSSQVGVLLDEIPASIRERVASTLLTKDDAYWVARAKAQIALAAYRLNFRPAFYDDADAKRQLPLPPESAFSISVGDGAGSGARRETIEGHDYVLVDYALDTVIVTDVDSPATSEPALAEIGGVWLEPFTFPVDPELLIQRTGFACMDEAEFPPNSVDTENVQVYYDQECGIEDSLTPDGCHYTELPTESCQDALSLHVGKVDAEVNFERIPWAADVATQYRVGTVSNLAGADLEVVTEELAVNQLIYRYVDENSCAVAEGCVSGTGWRRLLLFNASEKNTGVSPLNIGDVDYYLDDPENPTSNANHHIYEYSACHGHYHFSHYATFTYGDDPNLGSKRAFCLESVARYSNNEQSPTWSPYNGCSFQGISQGWGDQYNAGIECQWLDVTPIDTSAGPVTQPLGFTSNPDGFLCEGEPVLDDSEQPMWEPTAFSTADGDTVDRPMCSFMPAWSENNHGQLDVTLPVPGEGLLTSPCERGQIGNLRNCGFSLQPNLGTCAAATFNLSCSVPEGSAPQAIRICEASAVLGAGVACTTGEALAAADIESAGPISLTIPCPAPRDAAEPGGLYAIYTAPTFTEDALAPVTCALVAEGVATTELSAPRGAL